MLPYTSGYSTPVPSSSSLHFHASLPSHLSTELALLQTFIKRASAQHRSQLFLQLSEERKGEACIAWRWKGENLIKKMIKMLFSAHYITSQIIDLYHFLPLQTTVLSIYARLFTVTVSLANSLEMDVEQLLVAAGKATNGKRGMGPEENQKTNKVATGTLLTGAIKDMGMDVEMGEVIERSRSSQSLGRVSRSAPGSISEGSAFSPKPPKRGKVVSLSSTVDSGINLENDCLEKETTIVSKSVELPPSLQIDQLLDNIPSTNIVKDEKKKRRVETGINVSDAKGPKEDISIEDDSFNKKKKRIVKDEEGKSDEKTKAKKKKKKKDAMDDIFGF
ncbi:hypothetical protein D1P53_003971 [Cryptococcus gattii VGV]|nr:hypothetical protein D1P53_003971 [Cryptococcus gattii VGV]